MFPFVVVIPVVDEEQIGGDFAIQIEVDFQFVVEHGEVYTEVALRRRLPVKEGIACIGRIHTFYDAVSSEVDVLECIGT